MVTKANDIYNRWSDGQEVQTVLQHVVSDEEMGLSPVSSTRGKFLVGSSQPDTQHDLVQDPFMYTHHSLAQCIVEVHQRAKTLYPQRKPCSCSTSVSPPCPPSHFWAPPPNITQMTPVLPDLYSAVYQGGALRRNGSTSPISQPRTPLSPASRLAVVDTINFELGALNSNTDQSWMSFF